jgi:alpha-L-arabinofuranosidase
MGLDGVRPGTQAAPLSVVVRRNTRPDSTIVIRIRSHVRPASRGILGVNHHYARNGAGLWDPRGARPYPAAVQAVRRAGIRTLRFPGGTLANLYDWKRAIGDERGCQVDGRHERLGEYPALTHGLAFGPDEFMDLLDELDGKPLLMVPFVTETPEHAADWVEYMNSPAAAPGNPNGGVDWADVRAENGHPAAYGVRWWEIGNEQYHGGSRYWMSNKDARAMRQYAFGGRALVMGEPLGKECAHPRGGIASDGTANQSFEMLYPPVLASSVTLRVAGHNWLPVDDLSTVGARARVFEVDPVHGKVRFGDGTHGRIPSDGAVVRATYRSVHEGYFAFATRMKAVDPSIEVCATWGTSNFSRLVGSRDFDCLTAHAITKFGGRLGFGPDRWSSALQGHDLLMLATADRETGVATTKRSLAPGVPLLLTESSAIDGDDKTFFAWSVSASHAVHMSSLYAAWMRLGIPITTGDELMYGPHHGVIGKAPDFTFTAQAVTRQALTPMFRTGGTVVATSVLGNLSRRPAGTRRSYSALEVTAIRAPDHTLYILVVNRLPTQAVVAQVRLVDGKGVGGTAGVRTVSGPSFASWNPPGERPQVTLKVRGRSVGPHGFVHRFPAASSTVIRVPLR